MESDQFSLLLGKMDSQRDAFNDFAQKTAEWKGAITEKVSNLESQRKSDRKWGRVETGIVIPIMAVLHQVAAHLGWIK